jgi:hypothetical protein
MRGATVAGLLTVAILVAAGAGYLFGVMNAGRLTSVSTTTLLFYTVTSTSILTHMETMTSATTVTTTQTTSSSFSSPAALMTTSHHLLLQLTLANSTISQGSNITVGLKMTNLLSVGNDIPRGYSWAVLGLYWPGNPCSPAGVYEPLGIAIFSGYFSAGNISSGKSLYLWNPSTYYCPGSVESPWAFLPTSDVARTLGGSFLLDANFSTGGYWTTENQFVHFNSGTYTLVEGDEWGDLLFLYFTVG